MTRSDIHRLATLTSGAGPGTHPRDSNVLALLGTKVAICRSRITLPRTYSSLKIALSDILPAPSSPRHSSTSEVSRANDPSLLTPMNGTVQSPSGFFSVARRYRTDREVPCRLGPSSQDDRPASHPMEPGDGDIIRRKCATGKPQPPSGFLQPAVVRVHQPVRTELAVMLQPLELDIAADFRFLSISLGGDPTSRPAPETSRSFRKSK